MSRDALVVGLNAYQKLPSLNAPAQDAEAVARCLESFGEFRVYRLPEVIQGGKPAIGNAQGITTRMLEEALIRLFKPAGKNVPQTAIFYYSGHGLQRHAGIREGYIATSDVDPESGNYGLSLFWLRRLLQESPVRQRIIWLDCCHSGELLNYLEADPGAREGTDRLFMAASREYEPAYESLEGSHSVFTKALLSGLNPYKSKGGIVNSHQLTELVSSALKGEIQQPLFESSGSDIVLTRVAGTPIAVPASATTALDRLKHLSYSYCPFRGLQPFEEAHAGYFFGRERLTAQLADYVAKAPFCAVVGASGIGKTSLLKAGLIHRLRQSPSATSEVIWDIRQMTPGQNPLERLAEAFISPTAAGIARADQLRRAESFLQAGGAGLAQLVRATLNDGSTTCIPNKRLLLVVDQFEQVLPPQGPSEQAQLEEAGSVRSQFIRCLSEGLKDSSLPLHIVISLRSDQLERLRRYPDLYALVMEHSLCVPPMAYEQVKAAVVKPLEKIGLRYDANLIYTLMLDVVGAPGELPLLQLTLQELWRQREKDPSGQEAPKLTLETYAELGGVRNLLNKRASDFFQSLSEAEQLIARRIFLSLCELGEGTEDSRRRACLSELITPALPRGLVLETLEKLVEAHLVIVNHDLPQSSRGVELPEAAWASPQPVASFLKQDNSLALSKLLNRVQTERPSASAPVTTLDIVHESLIRTWPLLRRWLEEHREVLWLQRRLEAAALEWQQQGCPAHPEYLLSGSRLQEAVEFQQTQGHWLSSLALKYLTLSQRENRKHRWQRQAMQCLIPASILMGMLSSYGHFRLSQHWAHSATGPEVSGPVAPLQEPNPTSALAPRSAVQPSSHAPAGGAIDSTEALIALQPIIPAVRQIAPTALLQAAQLPNSLPPEFATQAVAALKLGAASSQGFAISPLQADSAAHGTLGATNTPVTIAALPEETPHTHPHQSVIVVWCTAAEPTPVCTTAVSQ